jgi:hypothetical protein
MSLEGEKRERQRAIQESRRVGYGQWNLGELMEALAATARLRHHGHVTIMGFTTHWKVAFGTPDLDTGDGREQVWAVRGFPTLREAVIEALVMDPVWEAP